ncbi:MAG: IS1096 element passenger TnpR family protein [Flavobacteriales bacterium]
MKAITYRVTPEKEIDGEEIYRDITITEDQSFEDLHYAILDAYEITPGEMASFYLSDDEWNKGVEITLFDMKVKEHEVVNLVMAEVPISKVTTEEVDNLIYVYDFLTYQTFHVSKIKEAKPKKGEIYPLCVAMAGSILADDDDDFKSEFEDDYDMGGGDDDDFGGGFEGEEDFVGGDDDFSFESDNFDNIDDHDL